MPTPKKKEKEDDFVSRCIPIVIEEGTTDDPDQAAAICHSMWRKHKKETTKSEESGMNMSWFEIKNQAEAAEIWIYGEIGGFGISAKDFIQELKGIKNKNIDMHINSPGGDVFDGAAVFNAIKRHPSNITSYIDGLAASIASIIPLAGNKVIMAENGIYMMHNPWGLVIGNADDMRKQAGVLDKIRDTMTGSYMAKSGKTQEEIQKLLNEETWLNADEALEAGFIDEIAGKMDMAACVKFTPIMARLGFKKIPEFLNIKKDLNERDLEKALRDAGCSRSQAKEILAKGLTKTVPDVRDAQMDNSDNQDVRDAQIDKEFPQREAEQPKSKKDRTAELLTRAELIARY